MAHLLAESFDDVRAAFENDRAPPPPVRAPRRRAATPSV